MYFVVVVGRADSIRGGLEVGFLTNHHLLTAD